MEGTNGRTKSVSKGRIVDHHAQRRKFRCTDIESLMEDDDTLEPVLRHSTRKPIAESIEGNRAQSKGLGRGTRAPET